MKETMTSRERVLRALDHKETDRVPIDLGGFQTGIHKRAYQDLQDYLGLNESIQIMDPVQMLARPSEDILRRFHVDTRYVYPGSTDNAMKNVGPIEYNGRIYQGFTDAFGAVWAMPEGDHLYLEVIGHPFADKTIDEIRAYPFPDGSDKTPFKAMRDRVIQTRQQTDCAISTGIGGVVYEFCWYLRGLENWFIDMKCEPEICEVLLDKTLKYWLDYYTVYMAEIGDVIDIVMIGDDLAGQAGPLFSPDFYRSIVKPRQKKLVQHIKSLTQAKVWYHTCGNCIELIPELIDNGIDILNPIQISAEKMDPAFLKKTFGEQLVFWGGGIDSQHVLPFASPDEVKQHVKTNLGIFKPGGGYVFNNVHNIQAGVPAENIIALYEAGYEYGFYD